MCNINLIFVHKSWFQAILQAFPERLRQDAEARVSEDPLRNADKSGRLWKFSELDDRIKVIDRELKELLDKDSEQVELLEQNDKHENEYEN